MDIRNDDEEQSLTEYNIDDIDLSVDADEQEPESAVRSEEGDAAENEDEDFEGSQIHVAKVEFTSSQFKNASNYDIIPFFASPHGVSINALSATPGMQFIFTGGADGFVRKYDFLASIAGELPLTLNQKHSFTDSITKGGVLWSYWDGTGSDGIMLVPSWNCHILTICIDQNLINSEIFSLAVQSQAIWILSGHANGEIRLQLSRFDDGKVMHTFKDHSGSVSTLELFDCEQKVISGGWDCMVKYFDLNTCCKARDDLQLSGQISSMSFRSGSVLKPINLTENLCIVEKQVTHESDSENSYDPLFDDAEDDNKLRVQQQQGRGSETVLSTMHENSVHMASTINGKVTVLDTRMPGRCIDLQSNSTSPPWCVSACWSQDGNMVYAGRRNNLVDVYDIRNGSKTSNILKLPADSGPVTALSMMINDRHLACASFDNIRLWNTNSNKSVPFSIVPGHHGATISEITISEGNRYMLTASGTRGWDGVSSDVLFGYEISAL